ncbi:uncharacterized protein K02A2.6-like [Ischnura elegans]|uniref:uncharacterized protein K02A2.6-like n=1 Tax=Ischnura elegans TaxID=197161 RepID=UPI001ED8A920|nr:uncharacterized protein K02A2.6-like [Ischnura elegans]
MAEKKIEVNPSPSWSIPQPFSFVAEDWPRWSRRFERYRRASGLSKQPDDEQVDALIYTMGDDADDILLSFNLAAAEEKTYKVVFEKFNEHFVPKVNIIYERARFNKRLQGESETVEEFVRDLHILAKNCRYGALKEELVRDRLVVGLRNAKLSEALQLDPDLTLERAVTKARQAEEVHRQQTLIRSTAEIGKSSSSLVRAPEVDAVRRKVPAHAKSRTTTNANQSREGGRNCPRCGKKPSHVFAQCPARQSACAICKKKGHWAAVCRKKTVAEIDTQRQSEGDYFFLGSISMGGEPWRVPLVINKQRISFKVDTGADVTVIGNELFEKFHGIRLENANSFLSGPTRSRLPAKGKFKITLRWKNRQYEDEIYVVPGVEDALLGRPAISGLGILSWLREIKAGHPEDNYNELFRGLGRMTEPYVLRIKEGAAPYAVSTPRRVPLPLRDKVEAEIKKMEAEGIITPVEEPTDWCAPMVVVPKADGSVRICVDFTQLNKNIRRERHELPSVDECLSLLRAAESKFFSKLDASRGYYQIPLRRECRLLTTFITPFGRYCFNRLPMGLSSAGEHFQRRMSAALAGLKGVINVMDDILVFGATEKEHDERLQAVLQRLRERGITLNSDKCKFRVKETKFLGHIISASEGIKPDPDKITAIERMSQPETVAEIRRFLGMVHYHLKFLPRLADITQPLRELIKEKEPLSWTQVHTDAWKEIKRRLTSAPALALYETNRPTRILADSSSHGLGAVIEQLQPDNEWRATSFASRALTETERRYAQLEKEVLALTWACEKFASYVLGKKFNLGTDHKPLVALLGSKPISELSARVQRFRMRLMRFDYDVVYVPGKKLFTPDALSRSPIPETPRESDILSDEEVELYVKEICAETPMTDKLLKVVWEAQQRDEKTRRLIKYVEEGWPHKDKLRLEETNFYSERANLFLLNGLLVRGTRIYIPESLRRDMLSRLHAGHLGITKCRNRMRESVWWPGVSKEIQDLISKCSECLERRPARVEPLKPSETPARPWQVVGIDIFHSRGREYLVAVDYFSKYPEVARLENTRAPLVVGKLKAIFARHGIPEIVRADNGPPFSSNDFRNFAREYGFELLTSSPYHPKSNGQAEAAVKIVKNIFAKETDPCLGLLAYRSSRLESGYSPSELLMGRKLRTNVPMGPMRLAPKWPDLEALRHKNHFITERAKRNYNRRHRARELPSLTAGDRVWVKDRREYGTIIAEAGHPRSYLLETGHGVVRRNRAALTPARAPAELEGGPDPEFAGSFPDPREKEVQPERADGAVQEYRTRYGRIVRPPQRLQMQ